MDMNAWVSPTRIASTVFARCALVIGILKSSYPSQEHYGKLTEFSRTTVSATW